MAPLDKRWNMQADDRLKTVQVPTDGLRDGSLGNDFPAHSAQESFSVDILPCMLRSPDLLNLVR